MKGGHTLAHTPQRLGRWVSRRPRPERGAILLGHRRIFVLPTAAGCAFAAALLVMLVASINYNLGLGYGLVFLLAGVGIASIVHAFRNLLHLTIRPGRVEPVFAGDAARFRLLVHNARDARRPALRLRHGDAITTSALPPRQTVEFTLNCPTHRRGWMSLERVVLDTVWPLGLIRAWSPFAPDMRCLVYPAPEQFPPPLPEGPSAGLGLRSARRGDDDFAGLRTHQPADSPRHVAWKVVARGGPMLIKHFSALDGRELHLDWHALPQPLDVEARIARLTAWVLAARASGRPFALALPDGCSPVATGGEHVHACLKRLALLAPQSDDPA